MKRLLTCVVACVILMFCELNSVMAATYTVTYDCNNAVGGSGTAPTSQTVTSGEDFIPAINTCIPPTNDGNYHFSGWVVDGTNDVIPAGAPVMYNYTTDITLKARYTPGKFSVTTTNLSAGDSLEFSMWIKGSLVVDCGEGGTLSGSGVANDGKTITHATIGKASYKCEYATGGVKTITFDNSNITRYGNRDTIQFTNSHVTASVHGNLLSIFPVLGSNPDQIPKFYQTFANDINLTYISHELFASATIGTDNMFYETFKDCTSLETIPDNLFSGITTGAQYMFARTFSGCTSLRTIPDNLFTNITNGANNMFKGTFSGCTSLETIPDNLFSGITTGAQYMFYETFKGCTSLETIPGDLFSSVTTGAQLMFANTFSGCTGLTSIPSGLFSSFTIGKQQMFDSTFSGCTGLTSIPSDLFGVFTTGAVFMFKGTFSGCTGLTSIPSELFSGFTIGQQQMFDSTFSGCTGLTSIPSGLFGSFTTGHYGMFRDTFSGCTSLETIPGNLFSSITSFIARSDGSDLVFYRTFTGCTSLRTIPDNLFSNITNGAQSMFYETFKGCTSLEAIPNNLFSNITTGANYMFYQTFYGCTNLSGYIPPTLFSGLIANNSPNANDMMYRIFGNTGLDETCPAGTRQYETRYDTYWAPKVSCIPDNECPAGRYLDENTNACEICPENHYCAGEGASMQSCPEGLVAPAGTVSIDDCGKILRVDEDMLYLTQTKQSTPALAVKLDGRFYYAKIEPLSDEGNQMNGTTNTSLRTNIDGIEYYIHDNTIQRGQE